MSVNLYNATTDTLKNVAGDIINPKNVNEMIAPIENGTASKDYAVGEQFIMNDLLCEVTQAIAQGDTMVIGTNCEESEQLSKQIKDIKSDLTDYSVNTPLRNVTYYNGKLYQLNLDGTIGSEIDGVKRFVGENFAEIGTKEGSALAHTIYGMSVQDGIPTPSVPVEIQSAKADFRCVGKNLIPYPYYDGNSSMSNGITYTVNSDGSITANGTATANSYYNLIVFGTKVLQGNYILSKGNYDTTSIRLNLQIDSTTGSLYQSIDSAKLISLVDEHIFKIFVSIPSGSTVNNVTIHPMLTLADADQTYELYKHTDVTTGIILRAIEVASSVEHNLERDGKYYVADTVDWSEDDGYEITRRIGEVVLDGTETGWTLHGDGSTSRRFDILNTSLGIQLPATTYQKSNRFVFSTTNTGEWGTFRFSFDGYLILKDNQSVISNLDTLKTWLGTNKPRFDYVLATPTTESITSEQAQALLSLKTYDEATSISATGDIKPSVDLEYAKSEMGAKALTGHNKAYIAQELEGVYGVKNLIPYPYYDTSKTINGLTFTDNGDGSVTINGTCTDQTFYQFWGGRNNLITTYFLTENENYIMTLDVDGDINLSSGDCVLSLRTYPQNSTTPYQDVFYITKVTDNIRKQFTFTQPDGYIYSLLWLEFRTGAVLNNVTIKPMLRLASIQSNEYQPYAMSNYELTKKIKELETALIKLSSQ